MNTYQHETPWKHIVVDNMFSEAELLTIFKTIEQEYLLCLNTNVNQYVEVPYGKLSPIGSIAYPKLLQMFNTHFGELNVAKKVKPVKLYPDMRVNILHTGYKYGNIHTDSEGKLFTAIAYVYPQKSNGTLVYENTSVESVREIPWSMGRCLMFVPQKKENFPMTWHNYENNTNLPRVTLNMRVLTTKSGYGTE